MHICKYMCIIIYIPLAYVSRAGLLGDFIQVMGGTNCGAKNSEKARRFPMHTQTHESRSSSAHSALSDPIRQTRRRFGELVNLTGYV